MGSHLDGLLPKWCSRVARLDEDAFSSIPGLPRPAHFKELRTGDARLLRLAARDSAGPTSPLAVPLAAARGHRVPHSVTP